MSILAGELAELGLPDGVVAAESVITSKRMSPSTKFSCWLVSEGCSYKDAANVLGLDPRHVYAAAKRHGINLVHDLRQHERGRILSGLRLARKSADLADLTPPELAKLI